ncbi:unnamed protein product, partial [marine sediment metagenome]
MKQVLQVLQVLHKLILLTHQNYKLQQSVLYFFGNGFGFIEYNGGKDSKASPPTATLDCPSRFNWR